MQGESLERKRPAGYPTGLGIRESGLVGLLFGLLLVVLLQIFLVFVALFAGFALFVGSHAAFVRAFLAFGLGLFTAGLLLVFGVLRRGVSSHRRARQDCQCAYHCAQGFDEFHIFCFKTLARLLVFPKSLDLLRLPNRQPKRLDWTEFRNTGPNLSIPFWTAKNLGLFDFVK